MSTLRAIRTGAQKAGDHKNDVRKKITEASYKTMGGRKFTDALSAVADRKHVQSYIAEIENSLGEKWLYETRHDMEGHPIIEPYFHPLTGDMVFPDAKGKVRILNGAYLEKQKEIESYIEDKVDRMMSLCVISDEMCMDVLNLTKEEYRNHLSKGKIPFGDADAEEFKDIDGRVLSIKATPAGSMSQTEKLSKLRYVTKMLRHRYAEQDMHRTVADASNNANNSGDAGVKASLITNNGLATTNV